MTPDAKPPESIEPPEDNTPTVAPPVEQTEIAPLDPGTDILAPGDDAAEEKEEEAAKKDGIKSLVSTIIILVIAPLIALFLTAFVFQSYEVDGPSMETTLQNKDRLIVYKLPKTIANITNKPYVPDREDIVIFTRQDNFEFGAAKPRQLIKRVIGLPGETVKVKDGIVTVFNEENPDGFRPDDAEYGKVIETTEGDLVVKVPEDHVFVCGDNRSQSLDSRAFGPVPLDDLVGKLALRVYPFGKGESF